MVYTYLFLYSWSRFLILFLMILSIGLPSTAGRIMCYEVAGCFKVPELWRHVPEPTSQVMTFAYYYDRNHRDGIHFNLYPNLTEVDKLPFDKKRKTFVMFHGHTDNSKLPWITDLKDAILDKVDGQIITPDYYKGANGSFSRTCGNLPLVGRLTRIILDKLGADTENLHVIGHSCGGQAASFVCKDYKSTKGHRTVKHLTVIDSPVKLIAGKDRKAEISKQDAQFVDGYHTHNGREPVGHIDVYFNGGIKQPPCEKSAGNYKSTASCCHHKAHDYYVSSVRNTTCYKLFPAKLNTLSAYVPFEVRLAEKMPLLRSIKHCGDNCMEVGLDIWKSSPRGAFMAVTTAHQPYCTPDSAFSKYKKESTKKG